MQKMYLAKTKNMPEITLNAQAFSGDFFILDTSAKVNISCVTEIKTEKSIGLHGTVVPGKVFTLQESVKKLYLVVESQVTKITIVVYGFFRRACHKAMRMAEKFCRTEIFPIHCRMAKLFYVGGMRL